MALPIKIVANLATGVTTVATQMPHPMETGLFKNKRTGDPIPAHYIQQVSCEHNGSMVMEIDCGIAISKDPYLKFSFNGGAVGDMIKISWRDNRGESESAETQIK